MDFDILQWQWFLISYFTPNPHLRPILQNVDLGAVLAKAPKTTWKSLTLRFRDDVQVN